MPCQWIDGGLGQPVLERDLDRLAATQHHRRSGCRRRRRRAVAFAQGEAGHGPALDVGRGLVHRQRQLAHRRRWRGGRVGRAVGAGRSSRRGPGRTCRARRRGAHARLARPGSARRDGPGRRPVACGDTCSMRWQWNSQLPARSGVHAMVSVPPVAAAGSRPGAGARRRPARRAGRRRGAPRRSRSRAGASGAAAS